MLAWAGARARAGAAGGGAHSATDAPAVIHARMRSGAAHLVRLPRSGAGGADSARERERLEQRQRATSASVVSETERDCADPRTGARESARDAAVGRTATPDPGTHESSRGWLGGGGVHLNPPTLPPPSKWHKLLGGQPPPPQRVAFGLGGSGPPPPASATSSWGGVRSPSHAEGVALPGPASANLDEIGPVLLKRKF